MYNRVYPLVYYLLIIYHVCTRTREVYVYSIYVLNENMRLNLCKRMIRNINLIKEDLPENREAR